MKNWIFIWHRKTAREWTNINRNLNTAIDFQYLVDKHLPQDQQEKLLSLGNGYFDNFNLSISPNKADVPNFIRGLGPDIQKGIEDLRGQILDSFEEESFTYVVERNDTDDRQKGDYILKEHLMPNKLTNRDNAKFFDLNMIGKYLDKHEWVALGSFFDMLREENKNKNNVLASSFFYTRDKDTNAIFNLSGGKHPKGKRYITCINYCVFKKLKDENIVLVYLNPNLVSMPHRVEKMEEGNHTVHSFYYTKDIRKFITGIKVRKGVLVNENTIYADEETVKIDLFGNSEYKYLYGVKPKIPYKIKTNLDYEVKHDILTLKVEKNGYLILDYDIETFEEFNINRQKASTYSVGYSIFKG